MALVIAVNLGLEANASKSVTVAWDPNPETDIAHYHVIYGTESRNYSLRTTVDAATSATITNLQEGLTYYFAVTAENVYGLESDPSVELSYHVPVTTLNSPPLAGADSFAAAEDAGLTISFSQLLANDTDPNSGDVISVIAAGPASTAGGTATPTGNSVVFTPKANFFGTDTFSYVIADGGGLTATGQVTVAISAVNDRPTISSFTNRTINEDTSTGSIGFTIGDVDNSASSLTVTRSSSNPTLVPTANIVLGGSGSSRTISVSPAPDQSGTTTIVVTVSDGNLSASSAFLLTVNPVNDAPVVFAGNDSALTLPATLSLNGAVTDDGLPNPAGAWTATWTKGSGPGTVTFSSPNNPVTVASFSVAGNYVLRLSATDGALTAIDEVAITVSPEADQTGPVVSGLSVTSRDARTIALRWTTDEPATSQVDYGPTTAVELSTTKVTTFSTLHVVNLSGLQPGAQYFVRVRSADEAGNTSVSDLFATTTPTPVILSWAAEQGYLASPMTVGTDALALDGQYVSSTTANQGTATYPVQVSAGSHYRLWCRVRTAAAGFGSFGITVDGTGYDVFDVAESNWTEGWRWVAVTDRAGDAAASPRAFTLSTNVHTIAFQSLEAPALLDDLVLSNDPDWTPGISGPPPVLTAVAAAGDRIDLQWTDTLADEEGFTIEWSQDGQQFDELTTLPAGVGWYSHGGLPPETLGYYRVYGFNQTDRTDYSNVAASQTPAVVAVPAAPASLKASSAKRGEVLLTWTDRSTNEVGFIVERSADGVNYETVQTLEYNITTTSDAPPGFKGRRTYYYRVVAFNAGGFSPPSNTELVSAK